MQVRFNILLYWIFFVIFKVLLLDSNEEKTDFWLAQLQSDQLENPFLFETGFLGEVIREYLYLNVTHSKRVIQCG